MSARPDHLAVFREFLAHLDRIAKRQLRKKRELRKSRRKPTKQQR